MTTSREVLSNHSAAGLAKRTCSSSSFFYLCAFLCVCGFFSDLARGWPNAPWSSVCDDDRMTDRQAVIDEHILHRRILPALTVLREEFGYSIPEAIDAFSARYEQLREARPHEFTVSREDYGKNFYS